MSTYTYHHDESPIAGAQRVLLAQTSDALALLNDQETPQDEVVHEVRKLFKRARATLRLLRDVVGEERFERENIAFRDAGRLLAAVRDSAVLVETLQLLPDGAPDQLRESLEQRHARITAQLLDGEDRRSQTITLISDAHKRIADWEPQAETATLFKGLRRVYKRGRRGMRRAGESQAPDDYHEWRKRVKYLWYHLEMLQPTWPHLLSYWVEELHVLSDLLGNGHDLHVLRETLAAEALIGDEAVLRMLLKQIDRAESELYRKARTVGLRLFAQPVDGFTRQILAAWQAWKQDGDELLNLGTRRHLTDQLLDSSQAAELYGLPIDTLRQMANDGTLPAFKVGNRWIFVRTLLN